MAQVSPVGTMDYGPSIATAVPIGGGVFLMILGIFLGAIAYRKISRNGAAGNMAASILLVIGAIAFSMTGGQMLHQAYAGLSTTPLSNPQGGTVDIFPGYQEYENTSGAPLKISAINLNNCPAPSAQALVESVNPQCIPGSTVLEIGGICTTNYPPCIAGNRVTFRAGYYWVRADYRAAASDHAAVCAEFGFAPTTEYVTLTWDAALLQTLSTDFGYLSNGDDNDAATSMWCWDGDGGPSTPAGYCETHNFGTQFQNYGFWGSDPDIRPVFTCMTAPP